MRLSVRALVSALVLAALAGCVDAGTDSRPSFAFDDAMGTIVGRLIDDALIPISGAGVILDGTQTVASDEVGRFEFAPVIPGPHTVVVSEPRFAEEVQAIDVVAGETAYLNLTLIPIAVATAYYEVFQASGAMTCSFAGTIPSFGPWSYGACGLFAIAGQHDVDQYMTDFDNINMGPDVTGAFLETTWDSNQALGNRMAVQWLTWPTPREETQYYGGYVKPLTHGVDPIRLRATADDIRASTCNDTGFCEETKTCPVLSCVMFVGHYAGSDANQTAEVVAHLQQRFNDFLTVFHIGELPVEFSALPDS